MRPATISALVCALLLVPAAEARAEWGPPEIAVQGYLTNLADEPVEGVVSLTFSIYSSANAPQAQWTEIHPGVDLVVGRFDLLLGSANPLDAPPLFEDFDDLWVGISVNGGPELPRAPLSAVGYAMQARHAEYCGQLDQALSLADLGDMGCGPGDVMKLNEAGEEWVCAPDSDTGYVEGWGIGIANGEVAADKTVLDGAYVEEDEENSISNEMLLDGAVSDPKVSSVAWSKLTAVPDGFADGIDNEGVLLESDPTIGVLAQDGWCVSDGAVVNCDEPAPIPAEDDPQVGANDTDYVPRWNGEALVSGSIWDGGNVGIGLVNPAGKLQVAGGLVRLGLAGSADHVTGSGDLYVENSLEVDGDAWFDGDVTTASLSNAGQLDQDGAADFAATVDVHGVLDMHDEKVENLATPGADGDAANKAYVDSAVTSAVAANPVLSNEKKYYTVVLALNDSNYCPEGYTVESTDLAKGPNGHLYVNISANGLFMGGMNSLGYGQEYLYARVPSGAGIGEVCSKTFTSTAGRPHVSVIMPEGGNEATCPESYHHVPAAATKGSNGWGYMMTNDSGMFMGYTDSWSRNSHEYEDETGYQGRSWSTHVGTICFKVMGVDEDPETSAGVFPVFLGVRSSGDCPDGWNVRSTSAMDGSNGHLYLEMNGNSSVAGGIHDWWHGGNSYLQVHFSYSQVSHVCWTYYTRAGKPFHQIRTPHAGNCPNDYLEFAANSLKGNNNNGHIIGHGHGLYMGGVDSWGSHDYSNGYIQHNFTSEVNNKVCLKMENVTLP